MHHSLIPLPLIDLDIWTDASSSWGIRIYIKSRWATWRLAANWAHSGQDIGWVEAIALELVVLWLAETGQHNVAIKVHCNNSNVINAFWKGCSRNELQNACIHRISVILATLHQILPYTQYTFLCPRTRQTVCHTVYSVIQCFVFHPPFHCHLPSPPFCLKCNASITPSPALAS